MNTIPEFDRSVRPGCMAARGHRACPWPSALLILLALLCAVSVSAQRPTTLIADEETIEVPLYKSRTVQLERAVRRVSVGNAEIADILILRSNQIYIQGKSLGSTNVLLWDSGDNLVAGLNVDVGHDLNGLKAKLHQLMPDEQIQIYSAQGSLALAGEVTSAARLDTAMQIARSYTGDSDTVVNLMSVGGSQQVMLKVTVAEVSRTVARRLGFKFNALDTSHSHWVGGGVRGGAAVPGINLNNGAAIFEVNPAVPTIDNTGLFASYLSETFLFNATMEASKENGSAKILAEPTLTTLSGQEARFLSGGEFPIPVPQGNQGITVEFKEFGIGLKFLPVVLDSGRINLRINVSVSDLLASSAITLQSNDTNAQFYVPALSTRSAYSTVELGDGQSIGIAGLISETTRDSMSKFPGLGDIPILGHLFRSQEFEKGETELVIMVTPQLARPMARRTQRLPTDSYVEPAAWEFYLLGRTGGTSFHRRADRGDTQRSSPNAQEPTPTSRTAPTQGPPVTSGGVEADFGHALEQDSTADNN